MASLFNLIDSFSGWEKLGYMFFIIISLGSRMFLIIYKAIMQAANYKFGVLVVNLGALKWKKRTTVFILIGAFFLLKKLFMLFMYLFIENNIGDIQLIPDTL